MFKVKIPKIEPFLRDGDSPFKPDKYSRIGLHVPGIIIESSSSFWNLLKMQINILHRAIGCLKEMSQSASSIIKNPRKNKKNISENDLLELKKYIKSLGTNEIGFTTLDTHMIFINRMILYKNVIVFTMEMKKSKISKAPSGATLREIFRTYYELCKIANKTADFLRQKGYNAHSGTALGGGASYVPLAAKAGLGEIGKHGMLISDKEYGPSLRFACVYTDIENLPFNTENQYEWIKDFCTKCKKCVKTCPAGAIYENSKTVNGNAETLECVDYKKCAIPFANEYGCTRCIKNCSFFNNDYYKLKKNFEKSINQM